MDYCKLSNQNKHSTLQEWMNSIISVTKTDTLLQRMDGCNKNGEKDKLPLKNRMLKISLQKK